MKNTHFRALMSRQYTKLRCGLALAAFLSTGVQAESGQVEAFDSQWTEPMVMEGALAESPFYPEAEMNMDQFESPVLMYDTVEKLNPESMYSALTAGDGTTPLPIVKGRVHIVSQQGANLGSPLLPGSFDTDSWPEGLYNYDGDNHMYSNRLNWLAPYSAINNYFPRTPATNPQTGSWTLVPGRKLDGNANMILYGTFSSWGTTKRDQIVALHLRVDRSGGTTKLHPVSMFAGDLDSVIPSPAGNLPGIMMYSNKVQLKNITGTTDEIVFHWKGRASGWVAMHVSGEAEAFVSMTDSTGNVYAAQVRFEFKDVKVFNEF